MVSNYSYKITKIAYDDINVVLDYYVNILILSDSAKKLYTDIEKNIDNICKKPMLNHNCKYYGINDDNFRYVKISNHLLFYYVNHEKEQIEILRFLYSKRNITNKMIKC